MLRFHATGDWRPDQVRTSLAPSTRRIVPEVERIIDDSWAGAMGRPGVKLFDGPMCRLESWDAGPDSLNLVLSLTSYKPFFGTNLSHPELAGRFGRDVMANPVGVSPALQTADDFLLMGRRNDSVAYYPGRTHPFAGALEPNDRGDLFAAIRRELAEELALGDRDVAEIRCTGVAEDLALCQPELLFRVYSGLSRAQIQSQVHTDEHHDSVAVAATRDAIAVVIADPQLTPVAAASLMLWGRVTFGEDWFRSVSAMLQLPADP